MNVTQPEQGCVRRACGGLGAPLLSPCHGDRPTYRLAAAGVEGLALTKCPGEAGIGPAPRNPNSPQALREEFGPP